MKRRLLLGLTTLSLAFAATVWADDATTAPATSTAPASQASTAPAALALASNDSAGITAAIDRKVAITGKISKVSATSTGTITFLNFDGNQRGEFVAIIHKSNLDEVNKGFDGDIGKAITGKKVTITGMLVKYKTTPQIEVSKPEQVTIVPDATTNP